MGVGAVEHREQQTVATGFDGIGKGSVFVDEHARKGGVGLDPNLATAARFITQPQPAPGRDDFSLRGVGGHIPDDQALFGVEMNG